MKILITNDDGIESNGIIALAKAFSVGHEVLVVAPDGNRSGVSHSLTLGSPIKFLPYELPFCKAFATSGSPADCVKASFHILKDFAPDAVLSGINKGHNFGSDVLYSGTVAAAFEAAFLGVRAFAFSAFSHGESDFESYAEYAKKIVGALLSESDKKTVWNVNFPDTDKALRGVRFSRLGSCIYKDEYVPTGDGVYELRSETDVSTKENADTDIALVNAGFVSVTPLLYDRTDFNKLADIRNKEILSCIR